MQFKKNLNFLIINPFCYFMSVNLQTKQIILIFKSLYEESPMSDVKEVNINLGKTFYQIMENYFKLQKRGKHKKK